MSIAGLRSAVLPVLYASSAVTLAVSSAALRNSTVRKSSTKSKSRPGTPRFNGQIVVFGRNGLQQVHSCLKKLGQARVIGLSFDYDEAGTVRAIKLASPDSAVLYPLPTNAGLLADEIKAILQSRTQLKVIYDGVDDVINLEKRLGIKLENFSDVYLDAVRLNKPDFPTLSEMALHCCDVVVEKPSLSCAPVDYASNSTGLPAIFKAVTQAWALTMLYQSFQRESAKSDKLLVYTSPSHYFTDSAMLSSVRRSAYRFASPMKELGEAVMFGSDCATPSADQPRPHAAAGGGGGSGGSGDRGNRSTGRRRGAAEVAGDWCGLPLNNDEVLRRVLQTLRHRPLTTATLQSALAADVAADDEVWQARDVRTESLFELPGGLALAFATTTAFGGVGGPDHRRTTAAHAGHGLVGDGNGGAGRIAQWRADDEDRTWTEFVRDEVMQWRSKMAEFLSMRDVLSLAQPSCHGSVSILTADHALRLGSESQSLRAIARACAASPQRATATASSSPPVLHNLLTELEAIRRVSPPSCHGTPPPMPTARDTLGSLPSLSLDPRFRLPALPARVPGLDVGCVHRHFAAHYGNVVMHMSSVAAATTAVLSHPVRGMVTSTSLLAAPL